MIIMVQSFSKSSVFKMFSVLTKTKRKSKRLQSPQAFSESWFSLRITAESRNKVESCVFKYLGRTCERCLNATSFLIYHINVLKYLNTL